MVKIGPAFFDSVSEDKTIRRRRGGSGAYLELVATAPVFFLAIIFLTIVARLFYVQVVRADYYKDLANNNRTRTQLIEAPRGIIFDRAGRPLVSNSAVYTVTQNKKIVVLPNDEALKLIATGKKVDSTVAREYLYKSAFAHVLGYVGQISANQVNMPEFSSYGISDFVGKMGLEAQYESLLHGQNGKRLYEVNSAGNYTRQLGAQEPIPGQNIKTTLDLNVQIAIKDAMKEVKQGAVVASDPESGAILALYSSPTFDPNVFVSPKSYKAEGNYDTPVSLVTDSDNRPLLNRAIAGAYPPGSTFKLIVATAALQKGSLTADTQIEDTGILKVGAFSFGNWYFLQYGRTEGNLNIVGAIKRSNDIFFYKTAEGAGVDNISSWATTFGLGKKLNIDLPGEVSGEVPTVEWKKNIIGEQWYLGDTYNYGIGQGYLLATPLQVNMYTDVFANGGTLYRPHLLESEKGNVIKEKFIDKKNVDLVREGMAEACETGGVAWPLFQFKIKNPNLKIDNNDYFQDASAGASMVHVKLGCKTGTAEVGNDKNPEAWITVFAPFNNPEIAVTVLVENGGEGSSIAGPIAKKILTDYFEKK